MKERRLTMNEMFLAQLVFRRSIDYHRVRVHDHGYVPFQPGRSGMTPNGEIYMKGLPSNDYAEDPQQLKALFIHEMVHVWQEQNRVLNPIRSAIGNALRHGLIYSRAYRYTLDPGRDLLDYRIEQQAQIVEDYYRVFILGQRPRSGFVQNKEKGEDLKPLYLAVLEKFIENPSYAKSA